MTAMDNVKNRIMADSPTNPRYKGVFDAYRQVWTESYRPQKGIAWNSAARVRNFYRVGGSILSHSRDSSPSCSARSPRTRRRSRCGRA